MVAFDERVTDFFRTCGLSQVITKARKSLSSEEILQDPYPTYARQPEEGPIHYVNGVSFCSPLTLIG